MVLDRLWPIIKQSVSGIGNVASRPSKVLALFGGSFVITTSYILALWCSVQAFGLLAADPSRVDRDSAPVSNRRIVRAQRHRRPCPQDFGLYRSRSGQGLGGLKDGDDDGTRSLFEARSRRRTVVSRPRRARSAGQRFEAAGDSFELEIDALLLGRVQRRVAPAPGESATITMTADKTSTASKNIAGETVPSALDRSTRKGNVQRIIEHESRSRT
ncbi:MAG: hypothetical protein QNM02_08305 [Acidimicrobiia bacterium]|nr:hypothetical protein [Acidimicrobiia bacterium]